MSTNSYDTLELTIARRRMRTLAADLEALRLWFIAEDPEIMRAWHMANREFRLACDRYAHALETEESRKREEKRRPATPDTGGGLDESM